MESSCCVDYNDIAASCLSRIECIVYNSTRIRTLCVLYDIHTCTLSPYFELIYSRSTERICCCNEYLFALVLELIAELSDSRCLACSVYAYDHDNSRRYSKIESGIIAHYLAYDFMDKLHDLLRIGYSPLLYLGADTAAYLHRSLNADITHYHRFFELFKKLLIYLGERIKYPLQSS